MKNETGNKIIAAGIALLGSSFVFVILTLMTGITGFLLFIPVVAIVGTAITFIPYVVESRSYRR